MTDQQTIEKYHIMAEAEGGPIECPEYWHNGLGYCSTDLHALKIRLHEIRKRQPDINFFIEKRTTICKRVG